jgi:CRISPR/Cas system-associated protein endoribonuclease Cas2
VYDFKDGRRFLDFAWIYGTLYLVIEIDGFTTHVKLDRSRFSDHLKRQNDLINDGWKILRFSYDDILERPRSCQQQLQQFMGRWAGVDRGNGGIQLLNVSEREIVRMASRRRQPFGVQEVILWLDVHRHTAGKLLVGLQQKDWIVAEGFGSKGLHLFTLNRAKEINF